MDTLTKLKGLFAEMTEGEIDTNKITPESTIFGDLGFSSMYALWMVFAVEREFGVDLSNFMLDQSITVKDVCNYIDAEKK